MPVRAQCRAVKLKNPIRRSQRQDKRFVRDRVRVPICPNFKRTMFLQEESDLAGGWARAWRTQNLRQQARVGTRIRALVFRPSRRGRVDQQRGGLPAASRLNRWNGAVEADMRQLRISRSWHFPNHREFQLGGRVQTTQTTAGVGPLSAGILLSGNGGAYLWMAAQTFCRAAVLPLCCRGRALASAFSARARWGKPCGCNASYWLEPSFGFARVTSGFAAGSQLLPWSGRGASLSLRHTFGRCHGIRTRPSHRRMVC
jgi:hypothetical protein